MAKTLFIATIFWYSINYSYGQKENPQEKIFNKKVINHLHGADFLEFYSNSGILKNIIFWSYSQIDVSIVLLPSMINQYSSFKKMKIEVISNCYSSEYLKSKVSFVQKKKQILLKNKQ